MPEQIEKYGFEAKFVLYKNSNPDEPVYRKIPLQKFYTQSDKKSEFWKKLGELEKKLSEKYDGNVLHLIVTSLQDIPETDIKKESIVAYNSLEL